MKNNLDTPDFEIRLGVYNRLRDKIKILIEDENLSNKECIDSIREMLKFLKAGDIED